MFYRRFLRGATLWSIDVVWVSLQTRKSMLFVLINLNHLSNLGTTLSSIGTKHVICLLGKLPGLLMSLHHCEGFQLHLRGIYKAFRNKTQQLSIAPWYDAASFIDNYGLGKLDLILMNELTF